MAVMRKPIPECFTKEWYLKQKESNKIDLELSKELNVSVSTFIRWKRGLGLGRFRKETLWDKYKDQALANKVSYTMFHHRIKIGKTPEEAIALGKLKENEHIRYERDDDFEYDQFNRIKYNPEVHENHRKPFEEEDLIYICQQYGSMRCRDIAFALGRTETSIYRTVSALRKNGKFEYYKSLEDEY